MTDEEWFAEANVCTREGLTLEDARVYHSYYTKARQECLLDSVTYEIRTRRMEAYMRDETRTPIIPMDRCYADSILFARKNAAHAGYYARMISLLEIGVDVQ
jgi:hypothetical protein